MKWLLPLIGCVITGYGFFMPSDEPNSQHSQSKDVTVIISGGARGHLSPCGCTKPMSGGLKRLATIVREMKSKGNVLWIDAGDIIDAPSRQSQLKAETYGELMGDLGVDAVAFTSQDQRQGVGLIIAVAALSKKKWIAPEPDPTIPVTSKTEVSGLSIVAANENSLMTDPERNANILIFDGPSKSLSQLKLVHDLEVFSSDGIPTINGASVSPGSNLRGVIVATFRGGRYVSSRVELLDPTIHDDANADKIYRNYLSRVTQERLIDLVTRENNDDYAGSKNCRSCHTKIDDQFSKTKHSTAYHSLVIEGHQADPDCVGCHVVGINSTKGFVYERTPIFAQVGCESCHGAGRTHAQDPRRFHLPKVAEQKCLTCHTPSNSPNFDFKSYWQKVKH